MTHEQAKKLMLLHQSGYVILVDTDDADGTVSEIYEKNGEIVFDNDIFISARLTQFNTDQVKSFKTIS